MVLGRFWNCELLLLRLEWVIVVLELRGRSEVLLGFLVLSPLWLLLLVRVEEVVLFWHWCCAGEECGLGNKVRGVEGVYLLQYLMIVFFCDQYRAIDEVPIAPLIFLLNLHVGTLLVLIDEKVHCSAQIIKTFFIIIILIDQRFHDIK